MNNKMAIVAYVNCFRLFDNPFFKNMFIVQVKNQ